MPIYLDNSATTRPTEQVIEAVETAMREDYFNPSALYGPALRESNLMRACREEIQKAVHAPAGSAVIFTSGGTESDNLAILGKAARAHGAGRILYSAGEHPAVKEACQHSGLEAVEMPYDAFGCVDVEAAKALMTPDTVMICCMQVNNETGAIQPLEEISRLRSLMAPDAHFHVDGVQGFLRTPFDMAAWHVDSYALSGHKIHAPKGIGALVVRPGVSLAARQIGGGQENALRSGTENTPGIAGLMAAVRTYPMDNDMGKNKLLLWQRIKELIPAASVNGPAPDSGQAAPHILNVSLPPVRSETMLHAVESEGIYIGMGSACSSRKQKVSAVLKAMHTPQRLAESALRFSLCPFNTAEEMEQTARALKKHYDLLSKFQRR